MFKKVLIVDDFGIVNKGVLEVLQDLNITDVYTSQYCDEAYLKFKKASYDNDPFDLVITDLSFKNDHRESKLTKGEELIATLRKEDATLAIIVYSMHSLLQKVRTLVNTHHINAYICKDRNDTVQLSHAIKAVFLKELYLSPQVQNALLPKHNLEFDDYDTKLLYQLSKGLSQDEISVLFKNNNTNPSGISSIEKRISKLRIQFKANNSTHLVTIVKDLGLI